MNDARIHSCSGFDRIAADRLADEVAALVANRHLDSRSAAADALLDYRNPPRTERSDRIAALEREGDAMRTLLQRATEYLDVLADQVASAYRSHLDAADILGFVRTLRDDFEHKVTKPEERSARIAALVRENAELHSLFRQATAPEYLHTLDDGATIQDFVWQLEEDYRRHITITRPEDGKEG